MAQVGGGSRAAGYLHFRFLQTIFIVSSFVIHVYYFYDFIYLLNFVADVKKQNRSMFTPRDTDEERRLANEMRPQRDELMRHFLDDVHFIETIVIINLIF